MQMATFSAAAVAAPTVTSVSPNSGSTAGGAAVTITGTNFASGATGTFRGTEATHGEVASSTTITATTPAHAAGTVTVTVTVNGQSGSLTNGFTYTATGTISFIQVASATPQTKTTTVSATYPAAQTAGDLNIVAVGWNDTTSTVQVFPRRPGDVQMAVDHRRRVVPDMPVGRRRRAAPLRELRVPQDPRGLAG